MDAHDEANTPTNEDTETDWGEIMRSEDKGGMGYREPGRLATVHEKLMSPSRKKCSTEMNSENVRLQIEIKQKEWDHILTHKNF